MGVAKGVLCIKMIMFVSVLGPCTEIVMERLGTLEWSEMSSSLSVSETNPPLSIKVPSLQRGVYLVIYS